MKRLLALCLLLSCTTLPATAQEWPAPPSRSRRKTRSSTCPTKARRRWFRHCSPEISTWRADAEVRKRIGDLGDVPLGFTPAETAAFLRSESARYKSIVESGGIKTE